MSVKLRSARFSVIGATETYTGKKRLIPAPEMVEGGQWFTGQHRDISMVVDATNVKKFGIAIRNSTT